MQQPEVSLKSVQEIKTAFAHGEILKPKQRKEAARLFKHGMSMKKACLIAIKYAIGRFSEYGSMLHFLTLAWVKLGEKKWQKIIQITRMFGEAFELSLDRIFDRIARTVSRVKPSRA